MNKSQKKYTNIILIILAVILISLAAIGFWLYSGKLTPAKNKLFQIFPLPIAIVNGEGIPMQDFILRYQLAQKLNSSQNNQQVSKNIYDQMVTDAEISQVAQAHDVFVTQKQINTQYTLIENQTDLGSNKNFSELLSSYGLTESEYKRQVIIPVLLLQNLKIWFYGQNSLNPQEYSLANSLQSQIQNGSDMGELAHQYSQDPTGQSVQGDLGLVQITAILPELQETVDSMALGDVKIIPSRYGLDIVRLEQKTQNLYHLREIFLNGESFNDWLSAQTQNFKVKKLLGI